MHDIELFNYGFLCIKVKAYNSAHGVIFFLPTLYNTMHFPLACSAIYPLMPQSLYGLILNHALSSTP